MKAVNIVGKRFGRLVVVGRGGISSDRKATWLCRCDCGGERVVIGRLLRSGATRSCGCLSVEASRDRATRHGGAGTTEYNIWRTMRARCQNPRSKSFPHYGGRGIAVCDRWQSFELFLADMGERPPGTTLDRINNDLGYLPSNCRWATHVEQGNNRRNNVKFEIDGVSLTLSQWSNVTGVKRTTILQRLNNGWNVEAAITRRRKGV